MGKGMGGHQSAVAFKDEWLTPPHILRAFGPFDLDPCAPVMPRPWNIADVHYTVEDNGLIQKWQGLAFVNPPYGRDVAPWMRLCALHKRAIGLIFARTDTQQWFDHVWPSAKGILFLKGRLYFHHRDGTRAKMNGGAPSALIGFDEFTADLIEERAATHGVAGKFIRLNG